MEYGLPTSVNVAGIDYDIRSDFRVIMDIYAALNDPELEPDVRAYEVLQIFYPDADTIPEEHQQEAVDKCLDFLQGGRPAPQNPSHVKLIDWEQDYPIIIGPVNKVVGKEVRAMEHLHWWTFLSAYYEIGDCLFAQVVSIRQKLGKGKALDKSDREFYRNNKELIDLKQVYTSEEKDVMDYWMKPQKKGDVSDA